MTILTWRRKTHQRKRNRGWFRYGCHTKVVQTVDTTSTQPTRNPPLHSQVTVTRPPNRNFGVVCFRFSRSRKTKRSVWTPREIHVKSLLLQVKNQTQQKAWMNLTSACTT